MARAGLAVFATPEAPCAARCTLRRTAATAPPPPNCRRATCSTSSPTAPGCAASSTGCAPTARLALDEVESLAVLSAYGAADGARPARGGPGGSGRRRRHAALSRRAEDPQPRSGAQERSRRRGPRPALGARGARRRPRPCWSACGRSGRTRRSSGFLVQRQAIRALELRLRLGDDPMFGPWIGFGQGGTAADIAEDEAYDLPPLNLALASQLIGRSRAGRLLAGFRDLPPAEPRRRRRGAGAAVADRGRLARDRRGSVNPLYRRRAGRARPRRLLHPAAGRARGRARHPALSGGAGAAVHDPRRRKAAGPPDPAGGCRRACRGLPPDPARGYPLALLLAHPGVVAGPDRPPRADRLRPRDGLHRHPRGNRRDAGRGPPDPRPGRRRRRSSPSSSRTR